MERFDELYYVKPYVREFCARVTACRKLEDKASDGKSSDRMHSDGSSYNEAKGSPRWAVELSRTAFYPEGGGQPGDKGVLRLISGVGGAEAQWKDPKAPGSGSRAEIPCGTEVCEALVLDTVKKGDSILHICDKALPEGAEVLGILDWELRKDHMEAHSGEHIVSGLIHQSFGFENIGFHMGDPFVTIDFSGPLTWEQVKEIELLANEVIRSDIEFEEQLLEGTELADMEFRSKKELEGLVRIVTVPGTDVCACCGTHVERTGEVGLVKIISLLNRKKGARLEMLAGRKAIEYWQKELDQVTEVCRLLSLQPHELFEGVRRLEDEKNAARFSLRGAVMKLLEKEAKSLTDAASVESPGSKTLINFVDDAGIEELRFFCNKIMEAGIFDTCAAMSIELSEKTNYVIMSQALDLKALAKDLNAALSGRGGGSKDMIQGSFGADKDTIIKTIKKALENALK